MKHRKPVRSLSADVVSLSRCPVFIACDLSAFAFSSLLSFSCCESGAVDAVGMWAIPHAELSTLFRVPDYCRVTESLSRSSPR
jgi:hypothetical protein